MKITTKNLHISNPFKMRNLKRITKLHQILKFGDESVIEIEMWSRKTYTYLEIITEERCNCGVVAKPGIATGSRSK